jgi:hypothetical protein
MSGAIQHTAFKNGSTGKAGNHADYIAGLGKNAGKEDVIYCEDGNLPTWATDASDFFRAADKFERKEYTVKRKHRDGTTFNKTIKGRAYKEFEWSIPRSIKDPIAWAKRVAEEVLGKDFPYRLAVHDAVASDGGRNLNMHLMFSDRKLDGFERDRELFFKRAKTGCYKHRKTGEMIAHDPATGGSAKDRFWNSKDRPKWARELYETHVQKEIPDFKLVRSSNPEPKIGPKLKGRTEWEKDYEIKRAATESSVIKIRALKSEMLAIETELVEARKEQLQALLVRAHASGSVGSEALAKPVPVSPPKPKPDWSKFKDVASVGRPVQKPEAALPVTARPIKTQEVAAIEVQDQVDQMEWRKRVEALPEIERKRAGAALTFASHALAAIQEAGGDASRVDWAGVEMVAARESLIENRQEPDWVADAILLYSPAQVSQVRHERVRQMVARLAEAGRDHDRQMEVGLDGP